MKLWLDDVRAPPEGWTWVLTPERAIELLATGQVTHVSLDHDLGLEDERTGLQVALWIEEQAFYQKQKPPRWAIHSANPVGRADGSTSKEGE